MVVERLKPSRKRQKKSKQCIDNATSDYEIEKYQDRLAKLAGGVAIILNWG